MVQPTTKKLAQRELPITSQESYNTIQIQHSHTKKQHTLYKNIIQGNDFVTQNKDPRHISPPLNIPLIKISTHECNPKNDINTNTSKIQTQGDNAHIYNETCKHLITIPYDRLTWLWTQYNWMLYQPHNLIPPIQTFEIEITWLYQRYKHRIPKNDPLKNSHHALPKALLDYITTSFDITHSYFSSPVTFSTQLTKLLDPWALHSHILDGKE